ncbi:MAG: response regulator [Spirochaetales bacterium]|nr:response regulator [Spirochaetales bacterium]
MERQKNILLVEDEIIIATSSRLKLQGHGFSVCSATNGLHAVETIHQHDIDLVLMDINLGDGINGIETAAIIRKTHQIPIIFMTSHFTPELRESTAKIENSILLSNKYITGGLIRTMKDLLE